MIPGLDADDAFRMVEDEFHSVARAFTAHLHAAEYQRLKAAAMERATGAQGHGVLAIHRPVVGAMTDAVRRKHDRADKTAEQQRALRDAGLVGGGGGGGVSAGKGKGRAGDAAADDAETDETPWAGTPLFGLMERDGRAASSRPPVISPQGSQHLHQQQQQVRQLLPPHRRAPELARVAKVASTTRAAAGFTTRSGVEDTTRGSRGANRQGQATKPVAVIEVDDDDDDDDLDAPATTSRFTSGTTSVATQQEADTKAKLLGKKSGTWSPTSTAGLSHRNLPSIESRMENDDDDEDDLFNLRNRKRVKVTDKVKPERKPSLETTVKQENLDVIPSFL